MKKYDAVIIGGATAGSYMAQRLASAGHSALLLEQKSFETVGARYDIFHIAKSDFERFCLPLPVEGEDKAFEFSSNDALSAFGKPFWTLCRRPSWAPSPLCGIRIPRFRR